MRILHTTQLVAQAFRPLESSGTMAMGPDDMAAALVLLDTQNETLKRENEMLRRAFTQRGNQGTSGQA